MKTHAGNAVRAARKMSARLRPPFDSAAKYRNIHVYTLFSDFYTVWASLPMPHIPAPHQQFSRNGHPSPRDAIPRPQMPHLPAQPYTAAPGTRQIRAFQPITAPAGISAHAKHSRTAPAVSPRWASLPTRCHSPPADAASPGTAAPGTRQIRAFQPITAAAGISAHAAHSRTAPAVSTQWASQPKKSPAQRIYGHLPPVFRFPGSCPCKKILQIFLCPFTDSQKSCIMVLYIMTSEVLPYGT